MRPLSTWTLITLLLPLAQAKYFTLSDRQPISHFSEACTTAYNTPLKQCPELFSNRVCSMGCIQQLQEVSDLINDRCKGAKAEKNDLIGMFFRNIGVGALCANVLIADDGHGSPTAIAKTTLKATVQTVVQATQTKVYTSRATTQSTESQSVLDSASTSAAPSSVSTLPTSSASSSESTVQQPTINSAATLTQSPLSSFGSSTIQVASSSTSSSASPSPASQQDRNGGGGTPFDISVSTGNIVGMSSLVPTIICILAAVWFL